MDISWPIINNMFEFIVAIILIIALTIWKIYEYKLNKSREKRRDYEISLIKNQNDNIISALMLVIKNFVGIVDEPLMRLIYGVYLDRAATRVTELIEQIMVQHHSDKSLSHESISSWLRRDINIMYENDMTEIKGFTYSGKSLDTYIKHDTVDVIIRESFQCILNEKSIKATSSIIQQTFNEQKNVIIKNALNHKI